LNKESDCLFLAIAGRMPAEAPDDPMTGEQVLVDVRDKF
jgi:hypothetical protein